MALNLMSSKPPRCLYQYQPADSNTINNLARHRLYFSKPADFNDAFDCNFCPPMSDPSDEELPGLFRFLRDRDTNKDAFDMRFQDLERGAPNDSFRNHVVTRALNLFEQQTMKALNEMGVACLSAVPYASWAKEQKSMLMWSHYARKHTGFCLEFDTAFEPFSAALRVNYDGHGYTASCSDILTQPQHTLTRMLTTKAECWDYESEWRIKQDKAGSFGEYDRNALIAVYLGVKIQPNHRKQIIEILEAWRNQVGIYDMRGMSFVPEFGFPKPIRPATSTHNCHP